MLPTPKSRLRYPGSETGTAYRITDASMELPTFNAHTDPGALVQAAAAISPIVTLHEVQRIAKVSSYLEAYGS